MANEAGLGCADRGSSVGGYTFVSKIGPATLSGNVDRLAVFANPDLTTDTVRFAFFTASGNDLTLVPGSRTDAMQFGSDSDACHEFSAPGDFTAFAVTEGDFVGAYSSEVIDYSTSGGSGLWYYTGDGTEASSLTFSLAGAGIDSLTADVTAAGGVEVAATVDELALTEYNPNVSKAISFTAGIDELAITEYNPTVTLGISVSAGVDTLILTEYAAAVSKAISFTADVDELVITEYAANVDDGLAVTTRPRRGLLLDVY